MEDTIPAAAGAWSYLYGLSASYKRSSLVLQFINDLAEVGVCIDMTIGHQNWFVRVSKDVGAFYSAN